MNIQNCESLGRRRRLPGVAWVAAALLAVAWDAPVRAQDPQKGVSIGLSYTPGKKTGMLVLPIAGAMGDSMSTMLARDFDYSDRFTVVPSSAVASPAGPLNYALFAKLGVDGVVQGTLLPSGWLRIALHDVAKKAVANQKDFALPVPRARRHGGWRCMASPTGSKSGSPAREASRRRGSPSSAVAACGQLTAMVQM
jgi:hypothetical protein